MDRIRSIGQAGLFLSTRRAAARLGLSPRTLEDYRQSGEGPEFYRFGRRVRYHVADLEAWAAARRRNSTADDGRARRTPTALHRRKAPRRAPNRTRARIAGFREDRFR